MYSPPQNNFSVDQKISENFRRTKRLATVEMVLSCLLLLFGIIATILATVDLFWRTAICAVVGVSIWAPVLGIIAAGLGLGALRYENYSRNCLLVSHFVMCIISALASFILVIFTCFCITGASYWIQDKQFYNSYYDRHTPSGLTETLLAFEVIILIGALANMIANIVSSTFMCKYWCGMKNGPSTLVYIPQQVASGYGAKQAISLPPGAQVIFFPSNNQEGHVPVQTNMFP